MIGVPSVTNMTMVACVPICAGDIMTYQNHTFSDISNLPSAPKAVNGENIYGDANPDSVVVLKDSVLSMYDGYQWFPIIDPNGGVTNVMPFASVNDTFIVNGNNRLDRYRSYGDNTNTLTLMNGSIGTPQQLGPAYNCSFTKYVTNGVCDHNGSLVNSYIQILQGILNPKNRGGVSYEQLTINDGDLWWAYNGKKWHQLITPTGDKVTQSFGRLQGTNSVVSLATDATHMWIYVLANQFDLQNN